MTDRRPHWDDDLIDAVRDAVDVVCDGIWQLSEQSLLDVIAAVEDWQARTVFPTLVPAQALRASKAEAAIERVRALAEGLAFQPTDYDDDTEAEIRAGRAILRLLGDDLPPHWSDDVLGTIQ